MKFKVLQYSLKVWISSALLSPFIILPLFLATGRSITTSMLSVLFACLFVVESQLLITVISWLIMQLFINRIANLHLPNYARLLVILTGIIILPGLLILIAFVAGHDDDYLTDSIAYLSFVMSTAIWLFYYKLKPVKTIIDHPNL